MVGQYATPDANGLFREECRSLQGRVVSTRKRERNKTFVLLLVLVAHSVLRFVVCGVRLLHAAFHITAS